MKKFAVVLVSLVSAHVQAATPADYMDLNFAAGSQVLYEVQVRAANACDPTVGADWQKTACKNKPSPKVTYRAEGMSCGDIGNLQRIKLGTLEDMLANTADYRAGITLRYINEKVGANMVWLMPLFPNNDTWNIPDACDNLGSPYAVRDYLHASGMISQACIAQGLDEHSDTPCWGNASLESVIAEAHRRGMKVMLDVAFNHFGHNYQMYDYGDYTPIRSRISRGEDLNRLWDFNATYEQNLEHPVLIDSVDKLQALARSSSFQGSELAALQKKCPSLQGDALVRSFHMWMNALDWERAKFDCKAQSLEFEDPGFYLGSNGWDPSTGVGDNFTNNWRDVKFLAHHEENASHQHEFVRNREYLFRILNYWVSRGVDGFRLDHTTDGQGGMGANEWKYIFSKVDFYAFKRGQERPIFLAEEFGDQMGMNHVVDVMTEGYIFNMRQAATKNTSVVEGAIGNGDRFGGHTYVMTALEDHDEQRLMQGTGFDIWTGAGFWGIGATTWSTPMLLMGQEFGESWGLGFRRSDFLRARFVNSANYQPQGDALIDYYHRMISARLSSNNRALLSSNRSFLRPRTTPGAPDERIFAQAKWTNDGNAVFVFHNLWEMDVEQSYFIPQDIANAMSIDDGKMYKLVDALAGDAQQGPCIKGADLKWNFYVKMLAGQRAQWLRLELCQ